MCPSFGWIQNICSSPLVFVIPANSLLRTIAVYPSALDLPFSFSSLYYLLKGLFVGLLEGQILAEIGQQNLYSVDRALKFQ